MEAVAAAVPGAANELIQILYDFVHSPAKASALHPEHTMASSPPNGPAEPQTKASRVRFACTRNGAHNARPDTGCVVKMPESLGSSHASDMGNMARWTGLPHSPNTDSPESPGLRFNGPHQCHYIASSHTPWPHMQGGPMQCTLAPEYSVGPGVQDVGGDPSLTGYPAPWEPDYAMHNGGPNLHPLYHNQAYSAAMLSGDRTQNQKLTKPKGQPLRFESHPLDTDDLRMFNHLCPSAVDATAVASEEHMSHSGPCIGNTTFGWASYGNTDDTYPENLAPPADAGYPNGPEVWQGSTAGWGEMYIPLQDRAQPGGAGTSMVPRVEYDRRPRPVDFKPYTVMDYQLRNYDVKLQSGYWTLGKLGGRADEADVQVHDVILQGYLMHVYCSLGLIAATMTYTVHTFYVHESGSQLRDVPSCNLSGSVEARSS